MKCHSGQIPRNQEGWNLHCPLQMKGNPRLWKGRIRGSVYLSPLSLHDGPGSEKCLCTVYQVTGALLFYFSWFGIFFFCFSLSKLQVFIENNNIGCSKSMSMLKLHQQFFLRAEKNGENAFRFFFV